jgi:hypothetical protein
VLSHQGDGNALPGAVSRSLSATAWTLACIGAGGACSPHVEGARNDVPYDAMPCDSGSCTPYDFGVDAPEAGRVCRGDVENVVFITCALPSCHGGSTIAPHIGNDGDWVGNVVGKPSSERPDMFLVAPGDPANSWLAHKIVGDQCASTDACVEGGCGDIMPGCGQPLTAVDRETIVEWIRQGADGSRTCVSGS